MTDIDFDALAVEAERGYDVEPTLVGPDGVQVLLPTTDEDRWLHVRNGGVGASEVAAVLGESKYDSPYSLWARKTGRVEPEPRTKVQRRGIVFEQAIVDLFGDNHPEYEIRDVGLVRNRERPWELATPDRELRVFGDHAGLVECKTSGWNVDEWGEQGTDEIPVAYAIQCQWQMGVTGAPFVMVPVLFGLDDYREYLVRRDDDVIAYLRSEVHDFWHDHVLADVAPAVDGHEATTKAMRTLPTRPSIGLPEQITHLQQSYWIAKDTASDYEAQAAEIANRVRELLDGAEIGLLGKQQPVTNKMQAGRVSFDLKRFTEDHPDLAREYTKRGADFPVLRIKRPK